MEEQSIAIQVSINQCEVVIIDCFYITDHIPKYEDIPPSHNNNKSFEFYTHIKHYNQTVYYSVNINHFCTKHIFSLLLSYIYYRLAWALISYFNFF